jgi:FkbM family methyltransferase
MNLETLLISTVGGEVIRNLINRVKFMLLRFFSVLLEFTGLVSKSATSTGTYNGEEFSALQEFFLAVHLRQISVIDVGANYGDWSQALLHNFPGKDIFVDAIEPIPHFYEAIKKRSNDRIRPHNFAISIDKTEVRVARVGRGGTSFPDKTTNKTMNWHCAPGITGDDSVKQFSLKPNLIKIDTDGMDLQVLASF